MGMSPTRPETLQDDVTATLTKPDELRFLYAVNLALKLGLTPRHVINDEQIGIPHKRCWWFLEKWSRRQRYEYGVTLDLGWWTPAGKAWAEETLKVLDGKDAAQ